MKPSTVIELFQSPKNRQWYFRVVRRNGKTVAASEGYSRPHDCRKAALRFLHAMRAEGVVIRSE